MRVDVQSLSALPPAERGALLVDAPEDQWFERKSIRVAPDVLAKAIVGFANAEGGLIAVGLSGGQVEDVSEATRHVNALRRCPRTHCAPPPRVRFTELPVGDGEDAPTIRLVDVEPGATMHETSAGEVYLRVGDSTLRLNAPQRDELAYDRGAAEYEARPMTGVSEADLDPELVRALRDAIGARNTGTQLLASRSLVTTRGEVTIAATLLLGRHPEYVMPHAHVRVMRYLTPLPESGARQQLEAEGDIRIEGAIPTVIEQAARQVDRWLPHRRALQADGRFGPVPIVPRDAWLEGIVNAVVHRSYSMVGDHIRVAIFPDRLEIESPGRFPGVVDPDRPLDISRYARNPRVARVCNDLGFTQEKGEGIRRMFDEMRISGLSDPRFRQTSGSVRVTLVGTPRLNPDTENRLPAGARRALEVLRTQAGPMSTAEIAQGMGVQRPAAIRALKALRNLGEVVWRGTSPTDPRATWSLPRGG